MNLLGFITPFMNWWDGLDAARQVFYGIGLVAGFVSVVLAVIGAFGMDHADGGDAFSAHEADAMSLKPMVGFFLGFGLAGGMALDAGWALWAAIVSAMLGGGVVMGVIIALFRVIRSMRSDGTMRINDALGAVGTVYITVPPAKGQGGQVVVNFKGRQETFDALSTAEKAIASGDKIKVVAIIDGRTVMVDPL